MTAPQPQEPEPVTLPRLRHKDVPELCAAFLAAGAARRAAEKAEALARARLLERLGGHRAAQAPGYLLKLVAVAGTADRAITREMLGQTLKGRAGYDRLEVTAVPAPANDDGQAAAAA